MTNKVGSEYIDIHHLAKELAHSEGMSIESARRMIRALVWAISNHILEDRSVRVENFGVFDVRIRKAREVNGNGFLSGQQITIPNTRLIKFTPSGKLKAIRK